MSPYPQLPTRQRAAIAVAAFTASTALLATVVSMFHQQAAEQQMAVRARQHLLLAALARPAAAAPDCADPHDRLASDC